MPSPTKVVAVVAMIGVVIMVVALAAVASLSLPNDLDDMAILCLVKGGVPITNADGKLARCDFPFARGGW